MIVVYPKPVINIHCNKLNLEGFII